MWKLPDNNKDQRKLNKLLIFNCEQLNVVDWIYFDKTVVH